MTLHVLMVTDTSGSMNVLRGDVVGGQNAYLNKLGEEDISLTQVLFNSEVTFLDRAVPVDKATRLTLDTYAPIGMTALLDAVALTIYWARNHLKRAEGDRVALYVMTDGEENSSHEHDLPEVNRLLGECEADGWILVYSGAGPEAWRGGRRYNTHSVNTTHDGVGTHATYEAYTVSSDAIMRGVITNSADNAKLMQDVIDKETSE